MMLKLFNLILKGMPKTPNFETAEKSFRSSPEDFELQVHSFIKDPVATLASVYAQYAALAEVIEDFDIVGETYDLVDHFCEFMFDNDIDITDAQLHDYVDFGSYSPKGDAGMFSLLRRAGYPKNALINWLTNNEVNPPSEDRFVARQSLAILDRVYGNE